MPWEERSREVSLGTFAKLAPQKGIDQFYMSTQADRQRPDDLLTVADASSYLKVSRMTVWRWCHSGQLPAFKIGREWRIHRAVLDDMMQQKIKEAST